MEHEKLAPEAGHEPTTLRLTVARTVFTIDVDSRTAINVYAPAVTVLFVRRCWPIPVIFD